MNGFSRISIIGFLLLLLVGSVYFNDQVEFNSVEAKWELNDQYQIRDETLIEEEIDIYQYSLKFENANDYVEFPLHSLFTNNFEIEINIKINELTTQEYIFYANGDRFNGNSGIQLFHWGGNQNNVFTIHLPGKDLAYAPNVTFVPGTTYNVVFGYQNGLYMIIDGVSQTLVSLFGGSLITPQGNSYINNGGGIANYDNSSFEVNYLSFKENNILKHEYLFQDNNSNILFDNVGNKDGIIYNSTLIQGDFIGTEINIITAPGIDSYQVFENIRNNASSVNPLGFMDRVLDIPSQMVGFTNRWFDFLGFDFRSDLIGDTPSEVMQNTDKWYWNIFEWVLGVGN